MPEPESNSPSSANASGPIAGGSKRRPCDNCRKRKSRCEIRDGEGSCVLCLFHKQACLFNEKPRPRKRRKVSLDTGVGQSPQAGLSADQSLNEELETWAPPTKPVLIRQHRPVEDYATLKGPSLLKKTLGLQNHRHARHIGLTSAFEPSIMQMGMFDEQEELGLPGKTSLRRVNEAETFVLESDSAVMHHDQEIRDLDAIETVIAPHGHALINLYFRIVHPSFPIIHKKVYLEKYQRTHREFSPPLLAAVYILALNWWSYSVELAPLPKPNVAKLEQLALKTLGYIVHRPKLSTIQAGLLLLQRPEGDSWALCGQLVAIGQELGLHLDCSRWRIPSWERGLRKRLAWGLYMQDHWGALAHGRPVHITNANWLVKPVNENDFPERAADEDDEEGSTEVEKGRILFCEMIKLTEILSTILTEFFTLQAADELRSRDLEGGRWVLDKAKPIQLRLREWHSQLPESLRIDNIKIRKLNSVGYLHLSYYAAELTLHRRILLSLGHETDTGLISVCRNAAQTRLASVSEFVHNLRAEHLQSFWYFASKYCFALVGTFISLLWATASTKDEADGYREKLDEYRWTLRLSSKNAEFLDRAIQMIAESTLIMERVANHSVQITGSHDIVDAAGELATYSQARQDDSYWDVNDGLDEPEIEHWSTQHSTNTCLPKTVDDQRAVHLSPTQFSDSVPVDTVWTSYAPHTGLMPQLSSYQQYTIDQTREQQNNAPSELINVMTQHDYIGGLNAYGLPENQYRLG